MSQKVIDILNSFESIELREVAELLFRERRDTKYLAHKSVLPNLLEALRTEWKVLEVKGERQHYYVSHYFDDEELTSFYDHLKQRNNRQKFRFRKYANNDAFFEIKTKNNKGITEKDRMHVQYDKHEVPLDFVEQNSSRNPEQLKRNIRVDYQRISLFNQATNEKITIDTDVLFEENGERKAYENLMILELKQETINKNLVTKNLLRDLGLRLNSCSKYCLGILNLRKDVRHNRFKARLRILDKIEKEAV